uniref:Cyclin dependent kinase 11B n=1 Tax=Rousettus aegyptiacus TaxID=9407 RepID=A0A7J8K656_ROUAE|nr:cyclin dependent kinase 11B [Rousettus aegyptiacus]
MGETEEEGDGKRTFQEREGPPGAAGEEAGAGAEAAGAAEGAAGAEGAGAARRGAAQGAGGAAGRCARGWGPRPEPLPRVCTSPDDKRGLQR